MIPLKLGDLSFSLPTDYGELTLRQFTDLLKVNDDDFIEVLSALSGLDKQTWDQCDIIHADYFLQPYLEFLKHPITTSFVLPDKIQINGKWYPKPNGIGINTFGQKIALERAIRKCEKEGKKEYEIYAYIIALYMQPAVTESPYDEEKVDALVPEIMNCRISEVFPMAGFFLKNYEVYFSSKKKGSLMNRLAMRSGLASSGLKNLQNSQRFGLCRRLLIKISKKFFWRSIHLYT